MTRPLSGYDVLDLGQIFVGGYCGQILSYLGANVVKVEPPGGEYLRSDSEGGIRPTFQMVNTNKRSITVDLKTTRGKQALFDLAEKADALIENFTPGTMDRLGVGYEDLREVNPQLVYGHGSGYGDDGPYTDYPAMDHTIQARVGVVHTTGFPDGPPVRAGPSISDFVGGIHLATGVVAALLRRERTGEGEYVDVGMYDCMYPTMSAPVAGWVSETDAPPRTGNRHPTLGNAPQNVYEAADGYVSIMCVGERHWDRFAEVMGAPSLADDERFATKEDRAEHMDVLDEIVGEWTAERDRREIVETLSDHGIPSAPIQTIEEVVNDPQLEHRGMLNYLPNQGDGREELPAPGAPIQFRHGDSPTVEPAPEAGEHTEEVLAELAGYSEEDIEAFRTEN